jgi:hypothetical protein
MADAPPDQRSTPAQPVSDGETIVPDEYASSVPPPQFSGREHPRLIAEHHIAGRYGEDELVATDENGRRWYQLRPEPRRRYDLIGFNYTWWLIWIVIMLVVFVPWGPRLGY